MIIDYKEIPPANIGGDNQDTFELFTRDFLEEEGFIIIQHPDRGADGKKDMIVGEERLGVGGKTTIKWLVSCKHYAHGGRSVSDNDEPDIRDRVERHDCQGFLGVYSTIPSAGLSSKLVGISNQTPNIVYDKERIEKKLLETENGIKLARRYFPKSIEKYIKENPSPAKLFTEETEIKCDNCSKNLLADKTNGIYVIIKKRIPIEDEETSVMHLKEIDIYCACKGDCDRRLEHFFRSQGYHTMGWRDIKDLKIPTLFLTNIMAFINDIKSDKMEELAIEKMKDIFVNIFPFISRDLTEKESERLSLVMPFYTSGI